MTVFRKLFHASFRVVQTAGRVQQEHRSSYLAPCCSILSKLLLLLLDVLSVLFGTHKSSCDRLTHSENKFLGWVGGGEGVESEGKFKEFTQVVKSCL